MNRRFSGIGRLYGENESRTFAESNVCVVGVGGVGSWCVEALSRSSIGRLTLIDLDHVAESNTNRQLQALEGNYGKSKVQALVERARRINPDVQINPIEEFLTIDNCQDLVNEQFDYVIDCIDGFRIKAALIAHCVRLNLPVITVGGAGGQKNPLAVQCSDLFKTEQDPLLAKTRRQLRQNYHFPKNPKRRFGVRAVWSTEPMVMPDTCAITDTSLNCAGFGSAMTVTCTFAMVAVAQVLEKLVRKQN